MKLLEYEGKVLLASCGVKVPPSELVVNETEGLTLEYPLVLKSQVPSSDRKKKGGIIVLKSPEEFAVAKARLLELAIDGVTPKQLLAEEYIADKEECYMSFSYSTKLRAPVLALGKIGGTGVSAAEIFPIDILSGCRTDFFRAALAKANMKENAALIETLSVLWRLFEKKQLLLLEVNPLFLTSKGEVIAGDAKIIRDEALVPATEKEIIALGGDIAIIASGGGASMLNIDILMRCGGKPANYVEYSGNPPGSVVEDLTVRVLSTKGIRGVWVVGGTANFTDIYETMLGFVSGLKRVNPKPTYPIVIRRDGPRQKEAKEMLEKVAKEEGYRIEVYGPELSMSDSAKRLLELTRVS